MVWTYRPLADLPQVNDIVWCRFPHRQVNIALPADPPHPVLVREIERYDPLGRAIVHVSYGTTKTKKLRRELLDLIIDKPTEMALTGLKKPTRFDLAADNKVPLIWCYEFFPNAYSIGFLNADCIRRMNNRLRWRGLGP